MPKIPIEQEQLEDLLQAGQRQIELMKELAGLQKKHMALQNTHMELQERALQLSEIQRVYGEALLRIVAGDEERAKKIALEAVDRAEDLKTLSASSLEE